MTELLIVEDDLNLGPNLKRSLELEGFKVTLVTSLEKAREVDLGQFSLVLLDWMLPDGQGIDFLKEIDNRVPVIMLTARADLIDKVIGLETGASDYVTKPFEPRELVARIRAQLRVNRKQEAIENFEGNGLVINVNDRIVLYQGKEITLTKMEFDLLYLLAKNAPKVFSREKLLDEVWGYENYPTTRTVDTHVLQIRQKTHGDIIETIRGVGYRFNQKFN